MVALLCRILGAVNGLGVYIGFIGAYRVPLKGSLEGSIRATMGV